MAEAERQSAPETTPAPAPATPGGGVAALVAPSYGDVTSLVGALAAGPDEWRADVVSDMQRTSGNRAVMRMLDLGEGPLLARAPTAQAAKKKTGIAGMTGMWMHRCSMRVHGRRPASRRSKTSAASCVRRACS